MAHFKYDYGGRKKHWLAITDAGILVVDELAFRKINCSKIGFQTMGFLPELINKGLDPCLTQCCSEQEK